MTWARPPAGTRRRAGPPCRAATGCLLVAALMCQAATAVAGDRIAIVSSSADQAHGEVIANLKQGFGRSDVDWIEGREWRELPRDQPIRAVVAVGGQACRAVLREAARPPLICTLLPRGYFDILVTEAGNQRLSAVARTLDQPIERQLDLIRLALPGRTRIGLLLGPGSAPAYSAIATAAASRGLHVSAAFPQTAADLPQSLQRLLPEIDVLLALPDGAIFNGATIQNILHAALAARIPVVGFSASYVQAGAVVALYATPTMVGHDTAKTLSEELASPRGRHAEPPSEFEIGINRAVARSLGIDIGTAAELKRALQDGKP